MSQQATRDPYLFGFVGLADSRRERDLEAGLIEHMEKFLLELVDTGRFEPARTEMSE